MESTRILNRTETIEIISRRDGSNCFHPDCGKPFESQSDITFDHWIPQSLGGTWAVENLRLMHKRCNALKGNIMPNEDGTLPSLKRDHNAAARRAAARSRRTEVCNVCMSGRSLDYGQECGTCGSGPMPVHFPQWARMKVNECDHDMFWCWMCSIGMIDRKAAIHDVVSSGELD